MKPRQQLRFAQARVLDGAMATELEHLGADITGPLWSAHVLESAPEKIIAVHRAYIDAGADVLLTAGYQVSRQAYAAAGLDPARADHALIRSVDLAREAIAASGSAREILVAASLGPYGAALHDGSEYHGNYACTHADLVRFHQERIAVLAESSADLLAFETLPSLAEAEAIAEALAPWSHLAVWFSFNCPDTKAAQLQVAHGDSLRTCAALAAALPQTIAVGINCTNPSWLPSLIPELRAATSKPIVVYPNSGETWNAQSRCWQAHSPANPSLNFAQQAATWYAAGAQLIGGCCRTRPSDISQISAVAP